MDPSTGEVETKEIDIKSELSSQRYSQRYSQNEPYVHKVGIPPKQNLFKEFKTTVKETFLADDPLRHFKNQPRSRKFILGIQAIFPILKWARNYNLSKFKGDVIAGLTIASLCIPQVRLPFSKNVTERMEKSCSFSHLNNSNNNLLFWIHRILGMQS